MKVLKNQLAEVSLSDRTHFCVNGDEAINCVKQAVTEALNKLGDEKTIRPITLMLLDFQMPGKNGIEVLKETKLFLKEQAALLKDKGVTLESPEYVFLTAYMSIGFRKHLESMGVTKIYEKPLVDS